MDDENGINRHGPNGICHRASDCAMYSILYHTDRVRWTVLGDQSVLNIECPPSYPPPPTISPHIHLHYHPVACRPIPIPAHQHNPWPCVGRLRYTSSFVWHGLRPMPWSVRFWYVPANQRRRLVHLRHPPACDTQLSAEGLAAASWCLICTTHAVSTS